MQQLLGRIKGRLVSNNFPNEASVSFGVVYPVLQALGWDPTEPEQVMPEYSSGRGRVDFALCAFPGRPAVFIEVKGVGRSLDGDRQLFEYAFHEGVPLCVLTDGREWSFYLPSAQGSYDDRRVYRLQLDDRSPEVSEERLRRYLERGRVRSGAAQEAATKDYRDAAARREAARSLPEAWRLLVEGPEDLLIELIADQAEQIGGFRPEDSEVSHFLRGLRPINPQISAMPSKIQFEQVDRSKSTVLSPARTGPRNLGFSVFGKNYEARNANEALVQILGLLAKRQPEAVNTLAQVVRGSSRNHIARSPAEIYPSRPDLAQAKEFYDGWLVGTNIANREKISIIRKACEVFSVKLGTDIIITLPNA